MTRCMGSCEPRCASKGIRYYSEHDELDRVRKYREWGKHVGRVNTNLEQEGYDAEKIRERRATAEIRR